MNNQKLYKIIIPILLFILCIAGLVGYYFYKKTNNTQNPSNSSTLDIVPTKSQPTPTSDIPGVTVTPNPTTKIGSVVKVYFSKTPESNDDFTFTAPVERSTTRLDIGQFALEQLVVGPTAQEAASGLFSPIKFSGETTCGRDFNINIIDNVATIKFCRNIGNNGVGDDARIMTTIETTLKQFNNVNKVVVLNKDGNCFGDMSGENKCKN